MHISPFAYAYYNTAAYKILQRVYKFGGQPVVLDLMTKKFGADFDEKFGHKTGRTLLSATSGSLIGIGEGKKSIVIETTTTCHMIYQYLILFISFFLMMM